MFEPLFFNLHVYFPISMFGGSKRTICTCLCTCDMGLHVREGVKELQCEKEGAKKYDMRMY